RPDAVVGSPLPHDLGDLPVELVEAFALRWEGEAVCLVLRFVPAGAETELDTTVRDVVDRGHELREDRDGPEGDGRDHRSDAKRLRAGGKAGECRPGVERARGVASDDRLVVIRAEEPVELRVLRCAREREPLRPGDALLTLDHEGDAHQAGVTYAAVSPPSTRNVAPVTYDASSEARNSAPFTTSRGFASRPVGQCVRRRSSAAGSPPKIESRSGVSTGPGQSAFTRTFSRANWTASSRVIESTAPFDAVYEIWLVAAPTIATKLATLITLPPPRARRCGMPCLQQRKTPFVFTVCTRSHASTVVSSTEASSFGEMPALL